LIHRAVTSLSKEAAKNIRQAVHHLMTSFAYDNFNISFNSPEPTVENPSKFMSATSATAIPLFGVENPEALHCSQQLWERDPQNPSPNAIPVKINIDDLQDFHLCSTTNKKHSSDKMSLLLTNYAWHVRDILVRHGEHFLHLLPHLGHPKTVN
jgi:hypothetical protein